MLYLAEVQKKQKTGFISATKAELKLLACQRPDQSWNPLSGEDVVAAEEVNNLNAGALVLADLNANRQVQRIQDAGRPLVGILQSFSRQLEKTKSQEEEIATWRDSLNYQSQELNSRKLEMEARLEQLLEMEEDFKRLETQRQKIAVERQQMEGLQKEAERKYQELEGAWEHLRGEQQRLKEQQSHLQQTTLLDKATTQQIQELLASLSSYVAPETVHQHLNLSFEILSSQQNILDQHWQQLEQQRLTAQQQQAEVERQNLTLQDSTQKWQQAHTSLEQLLTQLHVQTSILDSKQEHAQMLGCQIRDQKDLYQQIFRLLWANEDVDPSQQSHIEELEKMPMEQLQQLVQELQRQLQKASQFVDEQEEELTFKQQTINELQAQLSQANEHERMNLETQLVDEQDFYRMLNETLVGQRQNLRERQQILSQHEMVLWQRQEINTPKDKINLRPLLMQTAAQQQQKTEELQKLEQQISQMADSIRQMQEMIEHQTHEQELKRQDLQNLEQNLLSLRLATSLCWGRVNLYQEMLQPVQDGMNDLRQRLKALADQIQVTGDYQLQVVAQLQEILHASC